MDKDIDGFQSIVNLLSDLCQEALVEEDESIPPALFFTRAPEGSSIAQGATTISLMQRGADLFRDLVAELRQNTEIQMRLSEKELESELEISILEETDALERGDFDAVGAAKRLLSKIKEGRCSWNVFLPIGGLSLPGYQELRLARGSFKKFRINEKRCLQQDFVSSLEQARWESEEKRISGINHLSADFDKWIDSSEYWFSTVVEGRPQGARLLASEAADLGIDILLFWAMLVGIDPETSGVGFPTKLLTKGMTSVQLSDAGGLHFHQEAPSQIPFRLNYAQFTRLTNLDEFKCVQAISNSPNPNPVEQKILLGIQQFAEATRLPSVSLKLVWYLSALETVLVKEREGNRHQRVALRLGKLLSEKAADTVMELYEKRRKPVHYGLRNQIGTELVTRVDIQTARVLAYFGIVHSLSKLVNYQSHDSFVDSIRLD